MKVITYIALFLLTAFSLSAAPIEKYRIVYPANAEDEEGIHIATALQKAIESATGILLPIDTVDSSTVADLKIKGTFILIRRGGEETFEYNLMAMSDRRILVEGGSCWAISKAAEMLAQKLAAGENPAKVYGHGNIFGQFIFPLEKGCNLRILDDNVWEYDKETSPAIWKSKGVDCTNIVRHKKIAAVILAFMPDVITLQECSSQMDSMLLSKLADSGYVKLETPGQCSHNFTPIYYNGKRLSPLYSKYKLYTPERYSNRNTKSFTSAVFELKENGGTFAILNTHLWWKSDQLEEGSTQARIQQIGLCIEELDSLQNNFNNLPAFILGDMNCSLKSEPLQLLTNNGFIPVQKMATVSTDLRCGHHICAPKDGCSRETRRKGDESDFFGAIDHFMIRDLPGKAEVKVFCRIQPYFTVELTDHYPNYSDISIK